jgi:predicted MFS family arabinose efflux permease
MSFLYPSLLAMSVQRVSDADRVAVVSSFTMFFEIGAAVGGLSLGMVGEEFGKRSTFLVGSLFAVAAFAVLVYERNRHVARRAAVQ